MKKVAVLAFGGVVSLAGAAMGADMDSPIIGSSAGTVYVDDYGAGQDMAGRFSGNVEGSFSQGKSDTFDLDNRTWALRGTVNYEIDGGFNIQGDADYGRTDVEDFDFDRLSGTVHGYYRPVEDYAFGAFFQASRYGMDFFDDLGIAGVDDTVSDRIGGIEAAYFNDLATVYGQIGYGKASWSGESADHYMGRLGVRYFVTDNIRLDVEGALHRFSYADADLDARTFKAVANYRADAMPFSVFAGYRFDEWEVDVSGSSLGSEKNHSVLAGLRFHFGSTSLKDEEKSGPIWSSTSLLP